MKHSGQRGSVLTEAAIGMPILLALLFGIADIAISCSDRLSFKTAMSEAVRHGSIDLSHCDDQASINNSVLNTYNAAVHSFLPLRLSAFNASITNDPGQGWQLHVSARAPVSCVFCLFFVGATLGKAEYSSDNVVPLEQGPSC